MYDLDRTRFLVGLAGGEITAVDEDGEVQWTIGLPAGVHEGSQYLDYMQPGFTITVERGVTPMVKQARRARANPQRSTRYESGANPDFRPRIATREQAQMRRMAEAMNKTADKAAKMFADAQTMMEAAKAAKPPKPTDDEPDKADEPAKEETDAKPVTKEEEKPDA
jgi:hypothetical protein